MGLGGSKCWGRESGRGDEGAEDAENDVQMADADATGGGIYSNFGLMLQPNTHGEYIGAHEALGDGYVQADFGPIHASDVVYDGYLAVDGHSQLPPSEGASRAPDSPIYTAAPAKATATQNQQSRAAKTDTAAASIKADAAINEAAENLARTDQTSAEEAKKSFLARHWKTMGAVLGTTLIIGGIVGTIVWAPWDKDDGGDVPTGDGDSGADPEFLLGRNVDFIEDGKPKTEFIFDLTDPDVLPKELMGFDIETLSFFKPDGSSEEKNRRTEPNGVWFIDRDKKWLSFEPRSFFIGGPAATLVVAANPSPNSKGKIIKGVAKFTFPFKPIVSDQFVDNSDVFGTPVTVNVRTGVLVTKGLKGMTFPAKNGTDDIAKGSAVFTGVEVTDPLDKTTNPTVSGDGKTLTVANQGVWVFDDEDAATFTPEDGFINTPYPAIYQIGDVKTRPSNVALIVINSDIAKLIDFIEATAAVPDEEYWARYKSELIDPTEPVDPRLWNEINSLARAHVRMTADSAQVEAATTFQMDKFPIKAITDTFDDWQMGAFDENGNQIRAPYDRSYFWETYITPITDEWTGLEPGKQGTRFVRLQFMNRILARYLKELV